MKNKYRVWLQKAITFSLLFVLSVTQVVPVYADNEEEKTIDVSEVEPENYIEISTVDELLLLAEACKLDAYSIGKYVELKADLDLKNVEFEGIPYFNGFFDGKGHTISNILLDGKSSQYGLFRYVGELGVVSDLEVSGAVTPDGSKEEVGGIVGVNYGVIQNCSFEGTVCGDDTVGGVAGWNCSTGQIISCSSNALVLATDYTGGIVGVNEGIVLECTSTSRINIEELEPELDLGGIDIGTLNLAQTVVTRSNMGGIAGSSTGVIRGCSNFGKIGYAHTGYNVGGIAGSQSGVIMDCTNEGEILGRKDVGGIVGQAAPYVESEYLSDQIEQAQNDVNRLTRTINGLSSSIEKNTNEAKGYAEALTVQLESTTGTLSQRFDQMQESVPNDDPEVQHYMDNISNAMAEIERIQNKEGGLTSEDLQAIETQMGIIQENTEKLNQKNQEAINSSWNNSGDLQFEGDNLTGLINSIQSGVESVTTGLDRLAAQTKSLAGHIYDSTAVIRGEEEYILDVSSIKTATLMDGVISRCINKGIVEGDLNAGGIAGTMNVEVGDDPESDLDVSGELDVATSSEINDIILNSINYGKVEGKKGYAGGVVGYQEVGLIYQCEGYGHVKASAGSYVGGIAGKSSGSIQNCYSMLDLGGQNYIGGIAGEGATIEQSYSIAKIDSEGERIGGVAGYLETGGNVFGNYFVKDTYDAIDDISYLGVAEPMSYEDVMQIEGMPEGFAQVQVAFELEDEILLEEMIAYGSTLTETDFPALENREDAYVVWPEKSVYTDIKNNLTIEAEYVPWTQSIAAGADNVEKPFFIAVGKFYEGTELHILAEEVNYPVVEGQNVLYSNDWTILSNREKTFEQIEGHFYVPESVDGEVQVWIAKDGAWVPVTTTVDGSYVVAEIPYEAAFAVVEVEPDNTEIYITIGVGIVVFILVIFIVIVHNKRKKKAK